MGCVVPEAAFPTTRLIATWTLAAWLIAAAALADSASFAQPDERPLPHRASRRSANMSGARRALQTTTRVPCWASQSGTRPNGSAIAAGLSMAAG
jgi:hypothetical protein